MSRKDRADELLVGLGRQLYYLDRHLSEAERLDLTDVCRELEKAMLHLGEAKAKLHQLGTPRRPPMPNVFEQNRPEDPAA